MPKVHPKGKTYVTQEPDDPPLRVDTSGGGSAGGATEAKQDDIIALIGDPADAVGDPTVIGLLKQIAQNTTPP